jgi:hypothetical protein
MKKEEFLEQIERLQEVYGEKSFGQERSQILWEKFKFEKVEYMRAAISNIIAETFVAPAASKIYAAIQSAKETTAFKEKKTYNWDCSWCGQSGFVEVFHIATGYGGALKCKCEFGDLHAKAPIKIYDTNLYPQTEFACKFWDMDVGSYDGPKKMFHTFSEDQGKLLAAKYYPIIKERLAVTFKKLPYDPNERISGDELFSESQQIRQEESK